ncbi:hypothetical protein OAT04_04855, partial [Candidatus Pelagibacter sp.]|nr:hypothetical protein [Candidatus Pelagibacter sp.]
MIKVAIIPCQNGLGHISRSVELSNLLSPFFKIFLISNIKKINKFKLKKSVHITNFLTNFRIKNKKYDQFWYKKVESDLKNINPDIVISDNLPEIVFLNFKCIIMSNFFWHEIFKFKNNMLDKTIKIIKKNNVVIFRNKIFKKKNNISSIGFIGKKNNYDFKDKNALLISFGSADKKNNLIKQDIEKIVYDKKRIFPLYIDPKYFLNKYINKNVKIANYDPEMFKKVKYAIIKPGFGSIHNCLKNKIIMFCYCRKEYNKEFFTNTKAIESNNLGHKTKNLMASYKIIRDNKVKKIKNANKGLWNGEKKIINT